MHFILKHAWIMFIAVSFINYLVFKNRSQKEVEANPDLKTGYDKLFRALLIHGNIPWVIMAIGDLTSQTNTVFDYFNPKSFNAFVLAFHLSIIVIWVLCVRWIYFKNGADFLVQHPGLIHVRGLGGAVKPTATLIRLFFALALLGGIIGMTAMWLVDFPTFPVK